MRSPAQSQTEARNPAAAHIDELPTLDMLRLMNAEDAKVAGAVEAELSRIAEAIDVIAEKMRAGGRLIYIGAGTSGRLGALDAAELFPTFGLAPDRVTAVVAGGRRALRESVEGAEDDADAGENAIAALKVEARDSVVDISASGRTPFVLGGMEEAKRRGALVVGLTCNRPSEMEALADVSIAPIVGPEIITGSTRLKAGTAQKMVLNMLSTGVMIKLGKTFGNLMVEVVAGNAKLRARARRMVAEACGMNDAEAGSLLELCEGEVKTAIVSALARVTPDEARRRLRLADGMVRKAIEEVARN